MAVPPVEKQVIYLVERLPPAKPEAPTLMDKVREIAGVALTLLGFAVLLGTSVAFASYFLGWTVLNIEALHTLFMTGIVSAVGGFHLAKGSTHAGPSAEFTAGPLAITI